jgi:cation transport regulator
VPYTYNADLPDSVRSHLPQHAQDMYREAFNSAWNEYWHDEARAHRVAWAAVKKVYHKDADGHWVRTSARR